MARALLQGVCQNCSSTSFRHWCVFLGTSTLGVTIYIRRITTFNGAKDPVDGTLDTANERALVFSATEKNFKGKTFSIPNDRVIDLEYGPESWSPRWSRRGLVWSP